ncbi:MAG TPA: hypothetical protein VN541_18005 [Tepidisphaeraceae bacterium]|nr:hypothetical protein [Tepidisphaeraceae bacterium]
MVDRIVHSSGIVVCENRYLDGMWEIQRAEDKGGSGQAELGHVAPILSMTPPDEQKYARCHYCENCTLIVVSANDVIPADQVPQVAK